jgi:REP element-mobilizing transposase RayT
MARPLRLQFAGALYHVTARGDRKASIYLDDTDRLVWLQHIGDVCAQFNFVVHGFCQMGNHYHILLETMDGNLSRGMQQLNGVYSQYFNRRHSLVGHVFQGRYKAILVQKETYLLELTRYIVLNPVRANLVATPEDWPWSSYRLATGSAPSPAWLNTDRLLANFDANRAEAIAKYKKFVLEGSGAESPLKQTSNQLILGDAEFVKLLQPSQDIATLDYISRQQRGNLAQPLTTYQNSYADRNEAMARAYASTAYTIAGIARHFNVSAKTASRAIRAWNEPGQSNTVELVSK